MQFKIDENLPVEVAQSLCDAGHDAITVHDQQLVGELDPRIVAVCQSEVRAIVTLDLDFSDIRTYPPGDYHGIIVLRPVCRNPVVATSQLPKRTCREADLIV